MTTATHFIIVQKSDRKMISGFFNRKYEDREYPEALIRSDTRTGRFYEVVEVTASDLIAKTYTAA